MMLLGGRHGSKATKQHRVGNHVSEGAQCAQRSPMSGGGADLLRSSIEMSGGHEGAARFAEIGTEREAEAGDGVRCLQREPGEGHFGRRRVDIPPRWY
jgi:hypothetical protein